MENILNWLIEPKQKLDKSRQNFTNKALFALIIPIIIEQFLALLVGIADTLMISYAGEAAVSGVSLVNQLNNVFIMIFTALASGGAIVASQYIGSKDRKNGILASSQLVMLIVLISIFITALLFGFGSNIFSLFFGKVEDSVYQAGMTYLYISAFSLPFLGLYNGCAGLFRSMSKTKVIMYVSIVMNIINVIGNYIGIFVFHAGVAGVAIPSLISRIFAALVMMVLTKNRENLIYIQLKDMKHFDGSMVKRILGIAVPNSVESGLFQISKVALSSIVAMFGMVQISANGIAQSFWSMAALFVTAMGPAFVTVIGQYMGAGDIEGADYYMKKLLKMTYLGAIAWNIVSYFITPFILQFYNISAEGKELVMMLVLIHNAFNALACPLAFSLSNGLRAAGDIKYTMYSAIFCTCVVRVALSIVFGIWMNMGVIGIAFAMAADWVLKAILMAVRYKNGKWQNFRIIG